jgi:hypothetical protein
VRDHLFQSAPTTSPLVWRLQGPAIVGDGAFDEFGSLVAMSKNATTMVVGVDAHYSRKGCVKVYRTDNGGGEWTQIGQTIYGDAIGDSFGQSVDISADGSTIICGSLRSGDDGTQPGYVRVFTLVSDGDVSTNTWKQIGQNITREANGDEYSNSVSISDDGETIAVGALGNDGGDVRVGIYHLDGNRLNWKQIGVNIDGGLGLSLSLSLSGNGKTVVVGSSFSQMNANVNEIQTGEVTVYRIDSAGSSWEQLGESIYGDNVGDWFGVSVDISFDGNTVAIGTEQSIGPGYARVFSFEESDYIGSGNWTKIGKDITGEAKGDHFGSSVSISDDGKTIAIGAYGNNGNGDDSGHVRVYRMSDSESEWTPLSEDIDGEQTGEWSGWSVSLSGDGSKVAIGSPYYSIENESLVGQVRVFVVE